MTPNKRSRKQQRVNRGPAAAGENRQALLQAARVVFAERGYSAPLSAIAKEAGVGQAVLYRHFPTRLGLARAVFAENLQAYDALVKSPHARTLHAMWKLVCKHLIASTAFVEMAVDARRKNPSKEEGDHMRAVVTRALPFALEAKTVPPDFTVERFLLGVRMAYGVIVTENEASEKQLLAAVLAILPDLSDE